MNSKDDDMRREYSAELIKSGERGKYAKQYRDESQNLIHIDPDLQERFPDSASVNQALREYLELRSKATP